MFKAFPFEGRRLVNRNGYGSRIRVRSLSIMNGKGFKLHNLFFTSRSNAEPICKTAFNGFLLQHS